LAKFSAWLTLLRVESLRRVLFNLDYFNKREARLFVFTFDLNFERHLVCTTSYFLMSHMPAIYSVTNSKKKKKEKNKLVLDILFLFIKNIKILKIRRNITSNP
jgi:hypothetical protein